MSGVERLARAKLNAMRSDEKETPQHRPAVKARAALNCARKETGGGEHGEPFAVLRGGESGADSRAALLVAASAYRLNVDGTRVIAVVVVARRIAAVDALAFASGAQLASFHSIADRADCSATNAADLIGAGPAAPRVVLAVVVRSASDAHALGVDGDRHGSGSLGFGPLAAGNAAQEDVRVLDLHGGRDAAFDPVLHPLETTVGFVVAEQFGHLGDPAEVVDQFCIGHGVGAAFKRCVYTMPQRRVYSPVNGMFTIQAMPHRTPERPIDRALRWAAEMKPPLTDSDFARAMGVKPQHVYAWKMRGMPTNRHEVAARVLGRSIDELVFGEIKFSLSDDPEPGGGSRTELSSRNDSLQRSAGRLFVSEVVKAYRDGIVESVPQAEGADLGGLEVLQDHRGHIAIRVRGDGLRPTIKDGAVLIVAPGEPCVPGEEVLIVQRDGTRMVKSLLLEKADAVEVSNLDDTKRMTIYREAIDRMDPVVATYPASRWKTRAELLKGPIQSDASRPSEPSGAPRGMSGFVDLDDDAQEKRG